VSFATRSFIAPNMARPLSATDDNTGPARTPWDELRDGDGRPRSRDHGDVAPAPV
jgi:hypothetical protein